VYQLNTSQGISASDSRRQKLRKFRSPVIASVSFPDVQGEAGVSPASAHESQGIFEKPVLGCTNESVPRTGFPLDMR
jgi:hypothetical protein